VPQWLLLAVELCCVGLIVAGFALMWVPGAFLAAGVLGVVACERWSVAETRRRREDAARVTR
jgi:hypothetical protein